jgi:hypothetical protein
MERRFEVPATVIYPHLSVPEQGRGQSNFPQHHHKSLL